MMNAALFTTPVQVDAVITESSGRQVWRRTGPAAARLSGTLTTSETRLTLTFNYTYAVEWPAASSVTEKGSLPMVVLSGAQRLSAVAWVFVDDKKVTVESGAPPADDAALEQVLTENSISVRKILGTPAVTPRATGGFDVSFEYFRSVVLEQLEVPPSWL
jgi:hypothetical protein